MFSMLAKLPLPACSRECAPSAAVPEGTLQCDVTIYPIQRDALSIFLSLWLLFSLFLYKTFITLIFFPVSDYFILFSLTYFLNLFI